ncbi:lytic transglycosylase domain-containing protein [Clostridium rectalis]|uniref:lytic transglycosylase domain-containing protein n=1 Tax=Clostridium rectalis TaxID=2040295 RepID=UPI000F63E77E|nr:lytic transglycosylase domain-containing protein [Clostridium rectalis]
MKKVVVSLLAVFFFIIIAGTFFTRNVVFKLNYEDKLEKYAKDYNIDPTILAGVIYFENNFTDINDEYKKGEAVGPFNLKDTKVEQYAKEMGIKNFKKEDIEDIDINIKIGAWYISRHFKDNDYKGLAAAWIERNSSQDDKIKNYAKQYYGDKIKRNAQIYKIVHPELR